MGQLSVERAETVRFTKLNHSSFYHIIIFRFPLLPVSCFAKQNELQKFNKHFFSLLESLIVVMELKPRKSHRNITSMTSRKTSHHRSYEIMSAINNNRQMRKKFSRYATSSSDTPTAVELQLGNRYHFIRDGTKKKRKMMRLHLLERH